MIERSGSFANGMVGCFLPITGITTAQLLEATLGDSWQIGHLPVLTLTDKDKFDRDRAYGERAASDIAEFLFDIRDGKYCESPRFYVPR